MDGRDPFPLTSPDMVTKPCPFCGTRVTGVAVNIHEKKTSVSAAVVNGCMYIAQVGQSRGAGRGGAGRVGGWGTIVAGLRDATARCVYLYR